jgi:UDP-GlcNAc3NAcA epimerase
MKKIITVVGARPQFIKAAAVSRVVQKTAGIHEILVHTGQHFNDNMSDVFFREMEIPRPDYLLEINSLSHGAMTGRMIEALENVLLKEKPDLVMVYGDTNSTLAGALAARKLDISVAHVEAGLRSFNMHMPEEVNRILTDRISDLLFCPTETAVSNLKREGFEHFNCTFKNTGDVMYDAALYYGSMSSQKSDIMKRLSLMPGKFVIATIHRQENTDDLKNLKSIIDALNEINRIKKVILPLHPRTRKIVEANNIQTYFTIIEPVGYFDIIELLKNCSLVITDSGGMQKEAFFFEKFCITVRNETEWTELVENGYNYLAGATKRNILEFFNKIESGTFENRHHFYGNGDAVQKVIDLIF